MGRKGIRSPSVQIRARLTRCKRGSRAGGVAAPASQLLAGPEVALKLACLWMCMASKTARKWRMSPSSVEATSLPRMRRRFWGRAVEPPRRPGVACILTWQSVDTSTIASSCSLRFTSCHGRGMWRRSSVVGGCMA